ncbi:hypothetical protein LX36DRAFT_215744 [Colletotrichum falcatum]|nr:hypothetical protein LX36DRAFT_215744 [Colletotrichum falcatum]
MRDSRSDCFMRTRRRRLSRTGASVEPLRNRPSSLAPKPSQAWGGRTTYGDGGRPASVTPAACPALGGQKVAFEACAVR